MNKSIMITGANSGIGKEVARQLALINGTEKIYLACRNEAKAEAAKQELEQKTNKFIFEIILMDVADPGSVRLAVAALKTPFDALVMNAGGGGKNPMALTKEGVTEIFAANVLGHAVLLEELTKSKKLKKVALYVGSEASRGIPKMKMKLPELKASSVDEFETLIDGSFFKDGKADGLIVYGQVKYVGEMWMSAMARKHPEIKIISMSPGSTQGTRTSDTFSPVFRFFYDKLLMPFIFPLLGLSHKLETGAKRIVDGITSPAYKSGVFYASKADVLTGPVVDQGTLFPDFKNEAYQDNADEAVHKYMV